jgi:CPA2 family monovalent cation:H+ antiporter-2
MNEHIDPGHYSDALVILAAAGIVIPTFARFRITPIIGFILVGILVGPYGLARFAGEWPWIRYLSIADPAAIAPIAELGVILLLFSIGLELSFGRLWRMRKRLLGFGGAEMLGSAAIIAFALFMAGNSFNAALGLGLALALSSTALVLPIAGPGTPVGKLALAMLLFEDIALVPIIFLLGALAAPAGADGFVHLGTVLGQGAVLIAVMMALGWFLLPSVFAQAARTKSPELFLSASLLIAIVSSLATMAVGLSPIVGALLAGLMIAETPYAEEVEAVTLPFKGLALGVFLITVGMSLNLDLLAANWFKMLLATGTVVFIKSVVTMALLRAGRVQRGLAAETSVLMASPSETTLIVLGAAAAGGLINQNAANFWQVVTAIGMTITPLLARIGHAIARRLDLKDAVNRHPPARCVAAADQAGCRSTASALSGVRGMPDQPPGAADRLPDRRRAVGRGGLHRDEHLGARQRPHGGRCADRLQAGLTWRSARVPSPACSWRASRCSRLRCFFWYLTGPGYTCGPNSRTVIDALVALASAPR